MPLFGYNFVGFFAVAHFAMPAKSALFRSKIGYCLRPSGTPPPLAGQAWGNLINKI
jgi:hypothetical protein